MTKPLNSGIRGFRENIIFDEEYNITGRAKGLWVFFDIEKRRPAKIHPDFKEKRGSYDKGSIDHDISNKIEAIDSPAYIKEFKVNMYDTHSNKVCATGKTIWKKYIKGISKPILR